MDKKYKFLVVEDEDMQREAITMYLRNKGHLVHDAANLSSAVAYLNRRTYHVALIDIMLAGMEDQANRDGLKVLDKLNELNEGTIPIIMSVQSDTELSAAVGKKYSNMDVEYFSKLKPGQTYSVRISEKAINTAGNYNYNFFDDKLSPAKFFSGHSDANIWESNCMLKLKIKGDVLKFKSYLINISKDITPLLPQKNKSEALFFINNTACLYGKFWCKTLEKGVHIFISHDENSINIEAQRILAKQASAPILEYNEFNLTCNIFEDDSSLISDFID
jgi:CheY-like chemotaxis protein